MPLHLAAKVGVLRRFVGNVAETASPLVLIALRKPVTFNSYSRQAPMSTVLFRCDQSKTFSVAELIVDEDTSKSFEALVEHFREAATCFS